MKIVNMHEAKTHLSRLIQEAVAGAEIVIAKSGKPLVKLVGLSGTQGFRSLGSLAGIVTESLDCWAPDEELEASFYGVQAEPGADRRVAERRSHG